MLREAPDGVVGRDFTNLIQRFDTQIRGGADDAVSLAAPNQTDLVVADAAKAERLGGCSLSAIDGFWGAVAHVERTTVGGRRQALRQLVRNLAVARGMPRRFTDRAALAFFGAGGSSGAPRTASTATPAARSQTHRTARRRSSPQANP
jgi:hypothetical protein